MIRFVTRSGDVIHPQLRPLGLGSRLGQVYNKPPPMHAANQFCLHVYANLMKMFNWLLKQKVLVLHGNSHFTSIITGWHGLHHRYAKSGMHQAAWGCGFTCTVIPWYGPLPLIVLVPKTILANDRLLYIIVYTTVLLC